MTPRFLGFLLAFLLGFQMTISSETTKSGPYSCNGATTVFVYGFKIFNEDDLEVTLTDPAGANSTLIITTDYTVSGVGSDSGGNVTTTSTYATGYTLTIRRKMTLIQPTDLQNGGAYYAQDVEDMVDRVTMISQQINEQTQRTLTVPVSDGVSSLEIPNKATRASLALVFDADGNATAGGIPDVAVSAPMIPVVQAASLSAARSELGLSTGATTTVGAAATRNLGADIVDDGSGNLTKNMAVVFPVADFTFVAAGRCKLYRSGAPKTWTLPAASSGLTGWNIEIEDATGGTIIASSGTNLYVNGASAASSYTFSVGEWGTLKCFGSSGYVLNTSGATASTTKKGIVALATAAEINTGTDATKALTASALAGSKRSPNAWVSMDAAGNIEKSFGVSSITVTGTGQRTVNFSTAMPDALYAVAGMTTGIQIDVVYSSRTVNNCPLSINSQTTGSLNNTACSVFFFGN